MYGKLLASVMMTALVLSVAPAKALDNITPPAAGFYDGKVNEDARAALSNSIMASVTARADTNATTTATAYTPRRAGDILVGSAGAGTNAVWIAKGTSTNDWVQVQ